MPTLIFLVQRKLVNQIFESKLSAGYLYAAPRQKSRFKETAICKHEGSRCCTIKGNLKERGKVTEGQNESKVKRFFLLSLQIQKSCSTSHLQVPEKTPVVFWVTNSKRHLSLSRCRNSRVVLLILHWTENSSSAPFIFQPLWRKNSCFWAGKTPGKYNAMGPHHHIQRGKQNGANRAAIYHPGNLTHRFISSSL